jgi:succinate dehydrogenase / fumarate reductase cytochrome b subunit
MGLKRNVPLAMGLRYRGRGGQLAFVLHRIGGLGMAIFVTMHIVASFFGGDVGAFLNNIYENWFFQIFVFFSALFHAINGLRITLLDLWPKTWEYQSEAVWLQWAVFIPIFGIAVFAILRSAFGG